MVVIYTQLRTIEQARQVESLNAANFLPNLPPDVSAGQGFLGSLYPADLIVRMSAQWPAVLALEDNKVVGFALLVHSANPLPEHQALISSLNQRVFKGKSLAQWHYVRCVLACVQRGHRRNQVLKGMYAFIAREYPQIELIVTRINQKNTASRMAHHRIGFLQYDKEVAASSYLHIAKELQPRL